MPYKQQRSKSKCSMCPLDGTSKKCYGISDIKNPEVAFIGEAPGRQEEQQGLPFVGPTGHMLRSAVNEVERHFHRAHKTNVILCRPANNNITSADAQDAIECCREGFYQELEALKKAGTKVLVAVGATAMEALNISGTLTKNRGSVYMMNLTPSGPVLTKKPPFDFVVIPTFHPSFLMRGMFKHEASFVSDIEKAYSLTDGSYKPPRENFDLFPSIQGLEIFTDHILHKGLPIAVDIETSGFIPGKARILMVGIATSGSDAIVIPFAKQGGGDYWETPAHRMRAHNCLKKLMAKAPTIFQNALFDVRHLERFGCPVRNIAHDVMLLHHAISPELPHNLGYIVSIYGKTPFWKDTLLASPDKLINMPDDVARTYNARDCVVLHQVLGPMIDDAMQSGTYDIYKNISLPLLKPVLQLMNNGAKLDKKALATWKRQLTRQRDKAIGHLFSLGKLPEGFNLTSGDHMRMLLYGGMPARYARTLKELEEYENNPKKNKNVKKYRELTETKALLEAIVPFPRVRHTIKKTESGQLAIDSEAMLNVQVAAANRLRDIDKLRKLTADHVSEKSALLALRDFITLYREYSATEKLLTTYTSFPVDDDGRVKFPYNIAGTNTGRFSSGNKKAGEAGNAQNIPKSAKKIFIPEDNRAIAQFDYSNLELRVMAEISDDDVLRDTFARGLNVHSENCKLMFGIDEKHPLWDVARRACKIYIFGRNYGGGLKGIHRRVAKEVPELNLTYDKFCEIDETYRKAHPQYDRWCKETVNTLRATRCLTNAFGRKRYFLGSDDEIVREGLNFPIQSTGADILNMSLCSLAHAIENGLDATMILTVHDSIVFEVPKGRGQKSVLRIIKETMETKVDILGSKISFPVDVEVGPNWGDLSAVKV